MPATYAHYRFGLAVLERLPEAQRSVIASEPDLFMIGLHGPDILFFYHPLFPVNRVIRLGRQLHRAPGLPFFRRAAEHCDNDAGPFLCLRLSLPLRFGSGVSRLYR